MFSALFRSRAYSRSQGKKSPYGIASPIPQVSGAPSQCQDLLTGGESSIGEGPSGEILKCWTSNSGFQPGKILKYTDGHDLFAEILIYLDQAGPWNRNVDVKWVW